MDSDRRASWVVVLGLMLAACDGPTQPPRTEEAPSPKAEVATAAGPPAPKVAATPESGPAAGTERRLTGVLRYTEIKPIKSVESYMGREFTLTTSEGPINVKASEAVSKEQLRAVDGATITVRGVYHPEARPTEIVQAPTDGDGLVMPWPAYYEVLELVSGPPKP